MLPVEIAVHHGDDGLIAVKIHDIGRNAIQFQSFASVIAAVTADDFKIIRLVAVLLADGTDGDGRKNPVLTDALHQSGHFFLVTDTERMILHRTDAVETDGVNLLFRQLRRLRFGVILTHSSFPPTLITVRM